MNQSELKTLSDWFVDQSRQDGYRLLLSRVESRIETLAKRIIVSREDNLWEKGEIAALRWFLSLPAQLVTVEETAKVSTKDERS